MVFRKKYRFIIAYFKNTYLLLLNVYNELGVPCTFFLLNYLIKTAYCSLGATNTS